MMAGGICVLVGLIAIALVAPWWVGAAMAISAVVLIAKS